MKPEKQSVASGFEAEYFRNFAVEVPVSEYAVSTLEALVAESNPALLDLVSIDYVSMWESSSMIMDKKVKNPENGSLGYTISVLPSQIEALDKLRINTDIEQDEASVRRRVAVDQLKEDYDEALAMVKPNAEPYFGRTKATKFLVNDNVGYLIRTAYAEYSQLFDEIDPTEGEKKVIASFSKALSQIENWSGQEKWVDLTQVDMDRLTAEIHEQIKILEHSDPDSMELKDFRIAFRTLINTFMSWGGKETPAFVEFGQLQKR